MRGSSGSSGQKGMIREFLKTPVYKDIIRDNLKAVSHTDGRSIVKAVMEEDPAVFLELVTTTPSLANALMGSLAELGNGSPASILRVSSLPSSRAWQGRSMSIAPGGAGQHGRTLPAPCGTPRLNPGQIS